MALSFWSRCCGRLLKMMGWTAEDISGFPEKCILLGVPHTSIWDFVIAYLYYHSFGQRARCMVKKELFVPPLSWLLRAMGAFPVDRSSPTNMLRSVVEEMSRPGYFHLAIAPEGTRKPVRNWKTGFHFIAKQTGVPVYLGYFDWGRKVVGRGPLFELSDDPRADMKRIQAIYEEMHLVGKHPDKYVTH